MGLFSSKKIYTAYAGSASLFEEQPATLKSQIMQTAIGNEGTMAGAIRYTIGTDTFARAKSMMRYAARYENPEKTGGYIRGFPTSNMDLIIVEPAVVEAALARSVGVYDNIRYTLKGLFNETYFVTKAIQEAYPTLPWPNSPPADTHWDEYRQDTPLPVVNPDTGTYYTASGPFEYARYSPLIELSEQDLEEMIGSDAYVKLGMDAISGRYDISFPYVDKDGTTQYYELPRINLGDTTGTYVMVAYDVGDSTYYWTYLIGSGEDPEFESAIEVSQREAEYLPVAVLMQDKVWFNSQPESELAITTNRLLKRIGTTGDEIRENFEASEEENKDQAGDKWDFFVHFAVPIYTRDRGAKEYLWFFFIEADQWSTFDTRHYYDWIDRQTSSQPINELTIREAGVAGYNVAYRWSYIHHKNFEGQYEITEKVYDQLPTDELPEISHYETRNLEPRETHIELFQREKVVSAEYQEKLDAIFGPGTPIGPYNDPEKEKDDENGYHDYVLLTKMNREGTHYDQILVMGLSMQYTINTKETDTGKQGYRFRYAQPQLFGTEEETKEFRIPILYKALKEVPTLHREEAVAAGLTATVFLVDKTKVPWYQRSFFKWLIVIIAVIIIVLAIFFPAFWLVLKAFAGTIAGALGGGALAAAMIYTVMLFAIGFIIGMAAQTITEEFGRTAGLIFTIIASVVMFYSMGGFQNIGNTWGSMIQSPGWMTAANFLNAVMPVYNMGYSVYADRVLAGLDDELKDFISSAKEKQQMLSDAWAGLGDLPDWIDPMDLVNMFRRVGSSESANGYLNRTLTLNPGVLSYEAITNFSEVALSLPKDLQETTVIDSMMQEFAQQRGAV